MGYMNFENPVLEKVFKGFKWTRNNTIQLFLQAEKEKVLDFASNGKTTKYKFQPILFQFQCIITTTDSYHRKLINHKNTQFGILVRDGEIIDKDDISGERVCKILNEQLVELENLLRTYGNKDFEEKVNDIIAISNHEYLHHGQFIVMFRESGVELPKRFKKAWAL